MAEVFRIGDKNKDDKLTKDEFIAGMLGHEKMKKVLANKNIDSILENF